MATTMKAKSGTAQANGMDATPLTGQRGKPIQAAKTVVPMAIGVSQEARQANSELLNIALANSIMIAQMYKKAHWQVKGHTFYQLHLLFDAHYEEQEKLVDLIAERIQTLGGVAEGTPKEVLQNATVENPPSGVLAVPEMISRLLDAHTQIAEAANEGIEQSEESKDWGTNDLLASEILPVNQRQYWFVSQHLIDAPLVHADGAGEE